MSVNIYDASTGTLTRVDKNPVFTGATASAAGAKGVVPAPAAGDEDKYLKGDGSWAEAAADDNYVGTKAAWDQMQASEKEKYKTADFTDDIDGYLIDDVPTSGSQNVVKSGGVYSQINAVTQALSTQALYFTSVACSATTGNFLTKSDANITADHVVAECTFANPSAITTDVTWTTANGSVTLNGTCASTTTANLVLVKKGN